MSSPDKPKPAEILGRTIAIITPGEPGNPTEEQKELAANIGQIGRNLSPDLQNAIARAAADELMRTPSSGSQAKK